MQFEALWVETPQTPQRLPGVPAHGGGRIDSHLSCPSRLSMGVGRHSPKAAPALCLQGVEARPRCRSRAAPWEGGDSGMPEAFADSKKKIGDGWAEGDGGGSPAAQARPRLYTSGCRLCASSGAFSQPVFCQDGVLHYTTGCRLCASSGALSRPWFCKYGLLLFH